MVAIMAIIGRNSTKHIAPLKRVLVVARSDNTHFHFVPEQIRYSRKQSIVFAFDRFARFRSVCNRAFTNRWVTPV